MGYVDRNGTFVRLSDQRLSKIKDSSAKRQDDQWPNKDDQHCYLSISKKTAFSVDKYVLWDQDRKIHQDRKNLFCA